MRLLADTMYVLIGTLIIVGLRGCRSSHPPSDCKSIASCLAANRPTRRRGRYFYMVQISLRMHDDLAYSFAVSIAGATLFLFADRFETGPQRLLK